MPRQERSGKTFPTLKDFSGSDGCPVWGRLQRQVRNECFKYWRHNEIKNSPRGARHENALRHRGCFIPHSSELELICAARRLALGGRQDEAKDACCLPSEAR